MKIGFDNEKYQLIQSEHIKERISQFDGKLYLELGGKLFDLRNSEYENTDVSANHPKVLQRLQRMLGEVRSK